LITLASILLSTDFTKQWGFSLSALGVLAACLMWGVDNNLTRNISAKDPLTSVAVKGLGAGIVSLLIALAIGNPIPRPGIVLLALLLGFLSYGLSIFPCAARPGSREDQRFIWNCSAGWNPAVDNNFSGESRNFLSIRPGDHGIRRLYSHQGRPQS
jgi:hypothetical protein